MNLLMRRKGVVPVDGFLVLALQREICEPRQTPQGKDGTAQDILDELRILVCFFRDIFLIRTLEQRIDGRGSLLLKKRRQFLDVDARHAFTISEPHACYGTLVMRPIRRYLLAARAE